MAIATKKVGQTAAKPTAAKPAPAPAKTPQPAAKTPQPAASKPSPAPAAKQEPQQTTALAKRDDQSLVPPELAQQMTADAEQYRDDFKQSDLATPYLVILQSNSPQVQKGGEEYVDGAQPGMIFNSQTKELWDGLEGEGVLCVPAHYRRNYNEWIKREEGGGFVAVHDEPTGLRLLATCSKNEKGHDQLPNGHELVNTANHFIIIQAEEGPQGVILAMTSTQLKKSKQWNTDVAGRTIDIGGQKRRVPMFFHSYRLRTKLEKNDKGSWYGWVVEYNGLSTELGAEYYSAAKDMRAAVDNGAVNMAPPSDAPAPEPDNGDGGDIPF